MPGNYLSSIKIRVVTVLRKDLMGAPKTTHQTRQARGAQDRALPVFGRTAPGQSPVTSLEATASHDPHLRDV